MSDLTKALIEGAQGWGADLVGIAPIERFKDVAAENHPSTIFPECKSVIVLGRRITRGTLRGIEEGTQFDLYRQYGYQWLEDRFLSLLTFKVSELLEDNRWEAVPLFHLPTQIPPMGIPVRENQPAPNVLIDFDAAAVRAGLGEISYLRVFVSKEFGPRQRFQIILTDAELEGTEMVKEPICPVDSRLAGLCPLDAIDASKEEVIEIAGKKMTVAAVDYKKCKTCKNGAFANRYYDAAPPDRLGALCTRSLVDYLDKHDHTTNKFKTPFRKRTPWIIKSESHTFLQEGSEIE